MMRLLPIAALLLSSPPASAQEPPKPLAEGLKYPASVAVGPDGKIYVSEIGEIDKAGDGRIAVIQNGKVTPLVEGLDVPMGIAIYSKWLFVSNKTKVLRIDLGTKKLDEFAPAKAFPTPPQFINDITADPE